MKKIIYLDNAATTALCENARKGMEPFLKEKYGNPSANYEFGWDASEAIENARKQIAKLINARPESIFFTSGGSESDNQAILKTRGITKGHIITDKIEHHGVLDACNYANKIGTELTILGVNHDGEINVDELEKSIKNNTKLISIMFANNEIGTIEPISKIGRIAKLYGVTFHTDAVQAFGHIPINVDSMNIDMLSASAHKFNGPKGVGFLYVRNPDNIEPLIWGGGQERGKRSGTENTAGIVGMGIAATQAVYSMNTRRTKEQNLRNYLVKRVLSEIPDSMFNGSRFNRLPGNANFSFKNVSAVRIVSDMDAEGICISAGSACAAKGGKPSHVIEALGINKEYAYGTIRLSLSYENTKDEIDRAFICLKKSIETQREY